MVSETLENAFNYLHEIFSRFYYDILIAVIILLIGFILGKLLSKIVQKLMNSLEVDKITRKATRVNIGLERAVGAFTKYFIYFIAIIMALNQLNITTTILQMFSAAILIIVIISIILAIKDFVPNTFAGFYLYRNKFIKEGEVIRVKGIEGTVKHINLVETKIETKEGDMVYIPNSALTKTEIIKVRHEQKKSKNKKHKKRKKR